MDSQTNSASNSPPTDTDLRPELKPIAARHGRDVLDFAIRLAGANTSLDWLLIYSQTHSKVGPQAAVLLDSLGWFVQQLALAKGWDWDKVMECMQDISRASKLAHPAGNA